MPFRRLRVGTLGRELFRGMPAIPSVYGFLTLLAFWYVLEASPISAAAESHLSVLAFSLFLLIPFKICLTSRTFGVSFRDSVCCAAVQPTILSFLPRTVPAEDFSNRVPTFEGLLAS